MKGLGAREDLLGHPLSARRLKQKQKQVALIRLVGPMSFMDVGLYGCHVASCRHISHILIHDVQDFERAV